MHDDRSTQLQELYGIEFPSDFFEFWEWHGALTSELRNALRDDLGMTLVGPFDVLAGRFDNRRLRYPAVLHWRYQFDPPEFFTVFSGDTDGLHWGYWFDAPGELAPCVSAFYASDALELWCAGSTLFEAVSQQAARVKESLNENIEYDPDYAADYRESLAAIDQLQQRIPVARNGGARAPTHGTPDRMGVVLPADAGLAGKSLLQAKRLWFDGDPQRFESMAQSYQVLGRPALASIARIHGRHPSLPRVDILTYQMGDYHSFAEALAEPNNVLRLEVGNAGLATIPDLSPLCHLTELSLWGNSLSDLPASLASCANLKSLNLHNNAFATIPDVLLELPQLESLQLSQNNISSQDQVLPRLTRLKELKLFGNPIPESSRDAIRQSLPDTELSF